MFILNKVAEFLNIITSFLENPDNLVTLSYVCLGSFAVLFCLGITDTVIVYLDLKDLLWSLGIILVPISAFISLSLLAPEEIPENYSFFWEATNHKIITIILLLGTALSIVITFLNCVSNNGLIVGLLMFLFKIFAAIISILVIVGIFNQFTSKEKSFRSIIITMIIFGLFSFLMKKLINGERVLRKKKFI